MLLTGSIVLGSLSLALNVNAALPLPKPAGAWATARSPLPRVSSASGWSQVNADLWRSGTTDAQFSDKTLTIKQAEGRVILSWDSFDIDVSHLVEFKQPGSSSIALNRVINTASPSKILGTLKANGQIYLINNNGFLFGANSVVDVNALVVSTLDISNDIFNRGISRGYETDKLAALTGNGEVYLRNPETGDYLRDAKGNRFKIGIYVEKGAQISTDNYGRVIMVAPEIINHGTITSPDGQVILAAATDRVYLQEPDSEDTVRGLMVEVETGGEVTNLGNIITERGNTTLMGFAVNQKGRISATTSVQVNGSIRLLARENVNVSTYDDSRFWATSTRRSSEQDDGLGTVAKVTFGDSSVTQVIPELADNTKAVAEQNQPKSSVEVMAQTVYLQGDSKIIAPSGVIDIVATEYPQWTPEQRNAQTIINNSRFLMEKGSLIDVSGIENVKKSMESNVIEVQLQTTELADSPVQKFSFINGKKIRIDIREGTPLANVQPAIDAIESTVMERSVEGGKVNLSSEGAVIIAKDAKIDISGGSIAFEDGYINTTQLLTTTGKILDIAEADPDLSYQRILGDISKTYKKWGVTRTWDVARPFGRGRFEQGYIQGQNAGAVKIKANRQILDGNIVANTVNGRHQRPVKRRAKGGGLEIDLGIYGQNVVVQNNKTFYNIKLDDIFPADESDLDKPAPLLIDSAYFKRNNLQSVKIKTSGKIDVPDDTRLALPDAGLFNLAADEIYVGGTIAAYGSDILFAATRKAEIGQDAILDVSGLWVNDNPALNPVLDFGPVNIDAGSITVKSEGNLILQEGSLFKANSGAWYQENGKLRTGKGGDITIDAKGDNSGNSISSLLNYGANFEAYSFAGSGVLTLGSNEVYIVPQAPRLPSNPGESTLVPLFIEDNFVSGKGFSQYSFISHKNGITIRDGVEMKPDKQNLVLTDDALLAENNTPIETITQKSYLPDDIRQPVNLDFTHKAGASGKIEMAVVMEPDAIIRTDPLAVVGFSSDTSIFMNGTVIAPAGEINLNINNRAGNDQYVDNQAIWLGKDSRLSVAGTTIAKSTSFLGLNQGTVLDGGGINLNADRGYIVMDESARIDISGATSILDVNDPEFGGFGTRIISTQVASNAGSISFQAAEGLFLDGKYVANSNRKLGAEGGKLTVGFRKTRPPQVSPGALTPFPAGPRIINVSQNPSANPAPQKIKPGAPIADKYNGQAFINLDSVSDSGFDTLVLNTPDEIRFRGDINLTFDRQVILNTPLIGWQRDDITDVARVNIVTAYAKIGSNKIISDDSMPGTGDAKFSVEANLIDLEGINNLQGFNSASLNSRTDIRLLGLLTGAHERDFKGTWNNAGMLRLSAQQVYPTTLSNYSIKADNILVDNVQTDANGAASQVLSTAGKITLEADTIRQAGVLRAPLGRINLTAKTQLDLVAGSSTSTSAEGLLIPFGNTEQNGKTWVYPVAISASRKGNLIYEQLDDKQVLFNSDNINFADGAVVDISGGGDVQAYEFIPGRGGSKDIFTGDNVFAVLPGVSSYAPMDHMESAASKGTGLQVGDSVYLSAANGLPEGNYALLPAHYALLEGGYLLRPESGFEGISPSSVSYLTDGTPVTAGYRHVQGTNIRDSVWSGFALETSAEARNHSEFILTNANKFFTEQAVNKEIIRPPLPIDAGKLSFLAGSNLTLGGELRADVTPGGRGSRVDIQADQLAVVNDISGAEGVVELLADDLNKLSFESLLLGGGRQQKGDGTRISVGSTQVRIGSGNENDTVILEGPEIILAASERVIIKRGAGIRSSEKTGVGPEAETENLVVEGDGALLRVSEGKQASVSRLKSAGMKGEIVIENGAKVIAGRKGQNDDVIASGAILMDASANINMNMNAVLELVNGSLNVGTERISMGDVPDTVPGLVFSESMIAGLDLRELVLTSRDSIGLYGNVRFDLDQVVLDGAGVSGYGDVNSLNTINANVIRFTNSAGESDPGATGTGQFNVVAREIEFGKGDYQFNGYDKVVFNAGEQIQAEGKSNITVNADLELNAQRITAKSGADTRITAKGHSITTKALVSTGLSAATGLGGRLDLSADSIVHGGRIELPAGIVNLTATNGSLILDNQSLIDVSGSAVDFNGVFATADGGFVSLVSDRDNVSVVNGARINISGSSEGSDAGKLFVSASGGEFEWNGDVVSYSNEGNAGGQFELDVNAMSGEFSSLNTKLTNAGFTEEIKIRQRSGDIVVTSDMSIRAHNVSLSSDIGNVSVQGKIDARGFSGNADGGEVYLSAGDNVEVAGSIDASASDNNAKGGYVELATTDTDNDGIGFIDVQGRINVSGGAEGADGEVWYRANRVDSFDGNSNDGVIDDVAIASVGAITGVDSVSVEAVHVYDNVSRIRTADINQWQRDTSAYMADALGNIQQRLGASVKVLPGLEIRNNGDISITAPMDFASIDPQTGRFDWRYGIDNNIPGIFTIRAGGNLLVNRSISDGFSKGEINYDGWIFTIDDMLLDSNSWSYRLVGGADLTSANVLDVVAGQGSVELKDNVRVRTGTGSVDIASGSDFKLMSDTSVVYTAGRAAASVAASLVDQRYDRWGSIGEMLDSFYAEYPVKGGDVSIFAKGNIQGAVNNNFSDNQFLTGWLVSMGNWSRDSVHYGELSTTWGVRFSQVYDQGFALYPDPIFRQNIGALGGGNIDVDAGGDINNLSVMIPTTGKQVGGLNKAYYPNYDFERNVIEISGGGNLDVNAGGDIYGGVYYLGKGVGNIRAGGGLLNSTINNASPVLALGDSQFNLNARGNISLSGVIDPFLLKSKSAVSSGYFFNYSQDSAVNLSSLSGDVVLRDPIKLSNNYSMDTILPGLKNMYPATLYASALDGDITIQATLELFPSMKGSLDILAAGNIDNAGTVIAQTSGITMIEAELNLIPSMDYPVKDIGFEPDKLGSSSWRKASTPLHMDDEQPVRIIAKSGSIFREEKILRFKTTKKTEVYAGKDIKDVRFSFQNIKEDDQSTIYAGRDLKYKFTRGSFGQVMDNNDRIGIAGPGTLEIIAGRNLDLASSVGIETIGDTSNPALSDSGADLVLMAGIDTAPDYDAFAREYIDNSEEYSSALVSYVYTDVVDFKDKSVIDPNKLTIARNKFKTLSADKRKQFLHRIFFNELLESGTAAATDARPSEYERGNAAIERLFPGYSAADSVHKGDINLYYSMINTVDGGNIELFAPAGEVNAGLSSSAGGIKQPDKLGIITSLQGNISAYSLNDFMVNQSRIFTVGGGDILIWSYQGDIDAGRGAKTALAAPAPIISFDEKGNVVVTFPPAVQGSGIRAFESEQRKGNVALFAPKGKVDAGEAGIGCNTCVIGAPTIVNAGNIDIGGTSVGVPTASASLAAGLTGVSNLSASSNKVAEESTSSIGKISENSGFGNTPMGFLNVELVGFGGGVTTTVPGSRPDSRKK